MTKRKIVAIGLLVLSGMVITPMIGLEMAYWSLLPSHTLQPSEESLPALTRAALWAECSGTGTPALPPAPFPFLLAQIVAFVIDAPAADPLVKNPYGSLLPQLAKVELAVLQEEGSVPRDLRHLQYQLRELAIATWISRHWSATQAIDTYGALVWMAEGRRGLRAGAGHYFGKPLESLDVGETVLLVAMTRSPARLDPACRPERAAAARNDLLRRMVEDSALDAAVAARAAAAPVAVKLDCRRHLTGGRGRG